MGRFIHPEVAHRYLDSLCRVMRQKKLSYENAKDCAYCTVLAESVEETKVLLDGLMFRPVTATPIEELEAVIDENDSLDFWHEDYGYDEED